MTPENLVTFITGLVYGFIAGYFAGKNGMKQIKINLCGQPNHSGLKSPS